MRRKLKFFGNLTKLLCICGSILVAFVFSGIQHRKYVELKLVEESLNARIEEERITHSDLLLKMEYNLSDTYVEEVAREKLGLLKSDEMIFIDIAEN